MNVNNLWSLLLVVLTTQNWSSEDETNLLSWKESGSSFKSIARRLSRSEKACKNKYQRLKSKDFGEQIKPEKVRSFVLWDDIPALQSYRKFDNFGAPYLSLSPSKLRDIISEHFAVTAMGASLHLRTKDPKQPYLALDFIVTLNDLSKLPNVFFYKRESVVPMIWCTLCDTHFTGLPLLCGEYYHPVCGPCAKAIISKTNNYKCPICLYQEHRTSDVLEIIRNENELNERSEYSYVNEKLSLKIREDGRNEICALLEKIWNHEGQLLVDDKNIVFPRVEIFGNVIELSLNLSGKKEVYSARDYSNDPIASIINFNRLRFVKDETTSEIIRDETKF